MTPRIDIKEKPIYVTPLKIYTPVIIISREYGITIIEKITRMIENMPRVLELLEFTYNEQDIINIKNLVITSLYWTMYYSNFPKINTLIIIFKRDQHVLRWNYIHEL